MGGLTNLWAGSFPAVRSRIARYEELTISHRNSIWLALFLCALAVRLVYFTAVGVTLASDAFVFDDVANRWVQTGFASFPYSDTLYQHPLNFRVTYSFLMATLYLLFGVGNHVAIVVFQILLDSTVAASLFYAGARAGKICAGAIAAAIYICLWDNFRWTTYILADTVLVFSLCALFVLSLSIVQNPRWHKALVLGLLVSWLLHTRPNGLILILLLPAYLIVRMRKDVRQAAVFAALVATSVLIIVGPSVMLWSKMQPTVQSSEEHMAERRNLNDLLIMSTKTIQNNLIEPSFEHDETNFLIYLQKYPLEHIKICLRKFVVFYKPTAQTFSLGHNVFNLMVLVPIYSFALVGLMRIRGRPLFAVVILFIVSLTLLHMLTWVDYDQRHRAPIMPFMVMLAAKGLVVAGDRLTAGTRRYFDGEGTGANHAGARTG